MLIYDFVVVLESIIVQYSAPSVFQTRVPQRMLGVMSASRYNVFHCTVSVS
jgi:hypothetical protein